MIKSHQMPSINCLNCGAELDGATGFDTDAPIPGNASICFYCGNVAIFNQELKLRPPTEHERSRIESIPEVIAFRKNRMKGN